MGESNRAAAAVVLGVAAALAITMRIGETLLPRDDFDNVNPLGIIVSWGLGGVFAAGAVSLVAAWRRGYRLAQAALAFIGTSGLWIIGSTILVGPRWTLFGDTFVAIASHVVGIVFVAAGFGSLYRLRKGSLHTGSDAPVSDGS